MWGGGVLRAPLVRRDEGPPSSQPRNNKTIRIPVDIAPRRHSYKPQCSVTAPSIGKARLQNYQWRSTGKMHLNLIQLLAELSSFLVYPRRSQSMGTHDHRRLRHTKRYTPPHHIVYGISVIPSRYKSPKKPLEITDAALPAVDDINDFGVFWEGTPEPYRGVNHRLLDTTWSLTLLGVACFSLGRLVPGM